MCDYINNEELQSEADFPVEMVTFKETLDKIEAYSNDNIQISADMVD